MQKICVIGLGNMGQAIFDILKAAKKWEVFGCKHNDNPNEKLKNCDVMIVAVKPQSFADFAASINIDLSGKMVISIMAGVDVDNIQKKLKTQKVVRTIPNLPLKVGQALTVWIPSENVSGEEKLLAQEIFKTWGEEIEVAQEEDITIVGTITGSGPAYFAYLTEQIEKFIKDHGLSDKDALKIARQVFVGSANLMKKENLSPGELRAKVTSKGGITQAAFEKLMAKDFGGIFLEGIEAAIKRTRELNQ